MNFKGLTKEDLKLIIYEYNLYIQNANENNLYKKGWLPVCISEFYNNDLNIILEERLKNFKQCVKCGFEFQDTNAENREHYCLKELDK